MQGFERMDREFTDAELLAGHLVPANSMFAFLAAHRAEVFPDAEYADLFAPPGFGRPSLPATARTHHPGFFGGPRPAAARPRVTRTRRYLGGFSAWDLCRRGRA